MGGCSSYMIIKGWEQCGLLGAFEKSFQVQAMEANANCSLFASTVDSGEEINEDHDEEDWEDQFQDVEIMEMMGRCLHDGI